KCESNTVRCPGVELFEPLVVPDDDDTVENVVLQLVDSHAVNLGSQMAEHAVHQVMREWPLVLGALQSKLNRERFCITDEYDERSLLRIVDQQNRVALRCRSDASNSDPYEALGHLFRVALGGSSTR